MVSLKVIKQQGIQILDRSFKFLFQILEFKLVGEVAIEVQINPFSIVTDLEFVFIHHQDISWFNISMSYVLIMQICKTQDAVTKDWKELLKC
jgi:hypothetical protein